MAPNRSLWGLRAPGFVDLLVLRRGTHHPSLGAIQTFLLKIFRLGPPVPCLLLVVESTPDPTRGM